MPQAFSRSCGASPSASAHSARRSRAVTIVDAEQLGGVMLEKLAELFDEERGSNTRIRSRRRAA